MYEGGDNYWIAISDGVVVTPVGHKGEIEHLIERARDEVTIMTVDEMVSLLGDPQARWVGLLPLTKLVSASICIK